MLTLQVDEEFELQLVDHGSAPALLEVILLEKAFLSKWLTWPADTNSIKDILAFVDNSERGYANNESMTCCILHKGRPVGVVDLKSINPALRKAEIGYWLSQDFQGAGVMTRACQAIIDFASKKLNIEIVEAMVAVENGPSRAVCERLGMRLEGIISIAETIGGRSVDHAHYVLTLSEEARR